VGLGPGSSHGEEGKPPLSLLPHTAGNAGLPQDLPPVPQSDGAWFDLQSSVACQNCKTSDERGLGCPGVTALPLDYFPPGLLAEHESIMAAALQPWIRPAPAPWQKLGTLCHLPRSAFASARGETARGCRRAGARLRWRGVGCCMGMGAAFRLLSRCDLGAGLSVALRGSPLTFARVACVPVPVQRGFVAVSRLQLRLGSAVTKFSRCSVRVL